MKYLSALAFTGLLALPAYAQNGFYLSASAGAGISNSGGSIITTDPAGRSSLANRSPVLGTSFQLGLGYEYKNWRFQSGIQYIRSGYRIDKLIFGSDFNPNAPLTEGSGTYKVAINQVGIPLQVNYSIPLSNRLRLVPYAGVMAAFSYSGSSELKSSTGDSRRSLSGADLNNYGRFTLWGMAGMQLEYKLNNTFSLIGGPSIQYKLAGTGNNPQANLYNLHFNLGLKIDLGKGKK